MMYEIHLKRYAGNRASMPLTSSDISSFFFEAIEETALIVLKIGNSTTTAIYLVSNFDFTAL